MRTALLLIGAAAAAYPQVRAVTDPGVVTTRQSITPAGTPAVFDGRVYGVDFGATSGEVWVLNAGRVYRLDWRKNQVLERADIKGRAGLQSIRFDPASGKALASTARALIAVADGKADTLADKLEVQLTGVITVSESGIAVLPLTSANKLAVVDVKERSVRKSVDTGIAPFGAAINRAGTVAYVSNWGGRIPRSGDLSALTGLDKQSDKVVVDARGIASTGTVTRIDVAAARATHTIATGLHPTGIVWDEARRRVYVANSNSDSISVIDSAENSVVSTIAVQPFGKQARGVSPNAIAVSTDGKQLYVSCGGINAIAVIAADSGRLQGLIPTAWYPNALALSGDGKYLAVSTLLGAGSGWRDEPKKRFVHADRGSVAVIAVPDAAQLASYTAAVAENNRLPLGGGQAAQAPRRVAPAAVPERVGEPSPIQHVVYIVKENRTYDQVLGDMAKGNGDASLVMFGEDVTPNHHRIADQFVLLDNFYASGGNSADGHQWVTQAAETGYCLWPGYTGRSYPFDGSDPIAPANSGFIWDAALQMKKTVRVYGEYAGRSSDNSRARPALLERWKKGEDFTSTWKTTAPIAALNKILAANYPGYTPGVPDVVRAQIFLADLKKWEAAGSMPNLTIIALPSDHTFGVSPGTSSAKAMVADNDLALGQMVEALTKSRFWKNMAIFVVEDDAQNGVDHVDGHRTVALVASPYVRRGHIDSTFYSHQSILKTVELILGLPTLSLFDMIASDMRSSFQNTPDLTGYSAVEPKQSLFELNPGTKDLKGQARQDALASLKMKWDVPDAVPTEKLNRILWRNIKGSTPYPAPKRAVFAPFSLDVDDDDR